MDSVLLKISAFIYQRTGFMLFRNLYNSKKYIYLLMLLEYGNKNQRDLAAVFCRNLDMQLGTWDGEHGFYVSWKVLRMKKKVQKLLNFLKPWG